MKASRFPTPALAPLVLVAVNGLFAHPGHHEQEHEHSGGQAEVYFLPHVPERTGPVAAISAAVEDSRLSGQGFWTFVAAAGVLPIPEAAAAHVRGAHGTIVVDHAADTVYWGLQGAGWIAYTDQLKEGAIVAGDPVFAEGNLHGGELFPRPGQAPLVAVADNLRGRVYLSDTSFQDARILPAPTDGPYAEPGPFKPTDVAFLGEDNLYVTDGYGRAFFRRADADVSSIKWDGPFFGGKQISKTPHGITYFAREKTLVLAARPEGEVKRMRVDDHSWLESFGLPGGSTVCDVDIWGDYALAPCLDGPGKSPGPIYILNLKSRTIASIIRPKSDLGFDEADHIHDAAWYFSGEGEAKEVFIVFTNWNPGGIGALKLVKRSEL